MENTAASASSSVAPDKLFERIKDLSFCDAFAIALFEYGKTEPLQLPPDDGSDPYYYIKKLAIEKVNSHVRYMTHHEGYELPCVLPQLYYHHRRNGRVQRSPSPPPPPSSSSSEFADSSSVQRRNLMLQFLHPSSSSTDSEKENIPPPPLPPPSPMVAEFPFKAPSTNLSDLLAWGKNVGLSQQQLDILLQDFKNKENIPPPSSSS